MPPDVLIVGGGLAGLATAHRLLEAGREVTLVEKRQRLGGRASSYDLDEFPIEIDNCQHLLTGSCRFCLRFIRDLVGEDALETVNRLPVLTEGGEVQTLRPSGAPVPFHLYPYLRSFTGSFPVALRAAAGLLTLRGADPERYPTAADWLRSHQPESLTRRLWWPLTVSALNETPERLALQAFKKWILTGLMDYSAATRMYFPARSLKDLYSRRLGRALEDRGLDLHRNTRVARIDPDRPAVNLQDGEWIEPNRLVAALPDRVLWARLPEEFRDRSPYDRIPTWDHAPIVSVHLLVEGDWDLPEFLLLSTAGQNEFEWMFAQRQPEEGTYVQFVKSAARSMASADKDILVERGRDRLEALIGARPDLMARQIVKEKNATLSLTPGTLAERFGPATPQEKFFVAGDWTRSGWPPTMEGAVRSGYLAAETILNPDGGGQSIRSDPRPEGFLKPFRAGSMT